MCRSISPQASNNSKRMTHDFQKFFQKNIPVIQLSITLAGILVTIFVAYIASRLSPLADRINVVNAQVIDNTQQIKHDEDTYIPQLVRVINDVDHQKQDIQDIKQTTHEILNRQIDSSR